MNMVKVVGGISPTFFGGNFLAPLCRKGFGAGSPPFKPPRRPRATAAGSLPVSAGGGGDRLPVDGTRDWPPTLRRLTGSSWRTAISLRRSCVGVESEKAWSMPSMKAEPTMVLREEGIPDSGSVSWWTFRYQFQLHAIRDIRDLKRQTKHHGQQVNHAVFSSRANLEAKNNRPPENRGQTLHGCFPHASQTLTCVRRDRSRR
jgi:hypothetical protein